ncbi:unnamed protein product [Oikopleura dioica]|uniref:Uncharacterized protein n=1 Tax=Oikopleura dioica TaxID=34765 RepID=E4X2T2_OIKDI|nr:unnamed protein product [Oikopleura dioica]
MTSIPRLQTQVKQVEEEMAIVQDKLEKLRADRLELHRRFYGGINDIANMQKVLEPQALDNQAARELIRRISNIEESISSFHDAMRNQSYSFRPFEIQDSARFSETT